MQPNETQLVVAVSPDMRPSFFLAGSESWALIEQKTAVQRLKEVLGVTSLGLAKLVGTSKRTVDGWSQDRPLRGSTLARVNRILAEHYGDAYVGARPDVILR